MIALTCLGVAEVSLEETMAYVRERRAFGRPLAQFEGISFPIAEHATQLEAARRLCFRGLSLADHGLPYTKESAMAKWWAPKVAVGIFTNACSSTANTATPAICPWNSACAT